MPSRYRCIASFLATRLLYWIKIQKTFQPPLTERVTFLEYRWKLNLWLSMPRLEKSSQFIRSFGGGQRVLHQECCRSHHVISAWNLTMHRIPDLYNFILNSSEEPTLHSSKPKTSSSSSRPSSPDSPSCHPVPTSLGTPKRPRQLSSLPCLRLFLWWLSSVSYFYSCWESGVDVIRAGQWEDIVNS